METLEIILPQHSAKAGAEKAVVESQDTTTHEHLLPLVDNGSGNSVSPRRSGSTTQNQHGEDSVDSLSSPVKLPVKRLRKGVTFKATEVSIPTSTSLSTYTSPDENSTSFTTSKEATSEYSARDLASPRETGFTRSRPLSHYFHRDGSAEALADRLSSEMCRAAPSGHHFLPHGTVEQILDRRAVERALESLPVQISNINGKTQEPFLTSRWSFWAAAKNALSSRASDGHRALVSNTAEAICNGGSRGPRRRLSLSFSISSLDPTDKCLMKIFATLLLIRNPSAIQDFIEDGLTDEDLPLVKLPAPKGQGRQSSFVLCSSKTGTRPAPPPRSRRLSRWSRSWVELFEEKQWKMLSPVFRFEESRDHQHYDVSNRASLPFTSCKSVYRGGRGDILKVEIHPHHHNFSSRDENPFFAVKRLSSREQLTKEVRVIKRIDDPHIITLLATYDHCGFYHLVMPWAECNLEAFWEAKMPTPPRDSNTLRWIAKQCLGVANGLNKVQHHLTDTWSSLHGPSQPISPSPVPGPTLIATAPFSAASRQKAGTRGPRHHPFYGLHGDIKPQNLLWFPPADPNSSPAEDMGTIKISDFGEGDFNNSVSSLRSTSSISYTLSYRPPECDHPDEEVEIRTATFDTWSLGCVYLEFITWYMGGWKLLLDFERFRYSGIVSRHRERHPSPFFEDTGQTEIHARVKPAVKKHFVRLLHDAKEITIDQDAEFVCDFVGLIETRMLVVDPHKTNAEGHHRISCHTLARELGSMGQPIGLEDEMQDDYRDSDTSFWRSRTSRYLNKEISGWSGSSRGHSPART